MKYSLFFVTFVINLFLGSFFCIAEEWPTYMHDANRSGKSNTKLGAKLFLQWEYVPKHMPNPAWPAPAKTDYWHREANLKPRVIYDRANHVVTDGRHIYFGTSADDKVYCLDAKTGKECWSFFTEGPVRLAPTIYENRLYFGSDDGSVYCVALNSGHLIWKINAADSGRKIPGNERIISSSPVRTGVLVCDGIAYFCAGIFPNEGVSMYAVDALSGKIIWKKSDLGISPQGYLLANKKELFVPTGRTTPLVFDRMNGKLLGKFKGHGGAYALLSNDSTLVYGSGDLGQLNYSTAGKKSVATFNGLQMLVSNNVSFLRSDGDITAINRLRYLSDYSDWSNISKKRSGLAASLWDLREDKEVALSTGKDVVEIDKKIDQLLNKIENMDVWQQSIEKGGTLWKLPIEETYSMILAENKLVIGGNNKVQMIDALRGTVIWSYQVFGKVYGLSAANGSLYVSTDEGRVYCFNGNQRDKSGTVKSPSVDNPYAMDGNPREYEEYARKIIRETGITKGYCLVINAGEGQLAYELAKQSNLHIIGIDERADKVKQAREKLDKTSLYGSRVVMHHVTSKLLPYTSKFANLVVLGEASADGDIGIAPDEVLRLVKPFGGMAYIGGKELDLSTLTSWLKTSLNKDWQVESDNGVVAKYKKGSERGFGEWTHQYADAGNTACSMDQLNGPVHIQWFGKPGPRKMINRHSRSVSPLVKDGRLFIPADNRIITVDSYNGTLLWEKEVPGSRLLGALKDFGNRVVTDDLLYITAFNECIGFNVKNGSQQVRLTVPQLNSQQEHDWGYVSVFENQIFGSAKKKGSTFTILGRINCDDFEGDFREMVTSDYLFSMDRYSGERLWEYRNGVVFNNTITVGGDYLYFIESRNNKAMSNLTGRMQIDHFCEGDSYIVKLDRRSGEKIWEKSFHFPYEHIMYLSYSDNVLLVTGTYNVERNVHYGLFAFNGDSGKESWRKSYKGGRTGGTHGEQWQHPVIIGSRIYIFPYDFNLYTGEKGELLLTKNGCGGFSGSANNLFARKQYPTMYSLDADADHGQIIPLTRVNRPGCWINIIPAGGLISVPESSSGCTCDFPVQTSIVFIPKNN